MSCRVAEAVTTDALLGGRLQLRQSASGHRAGTDAVLLAAAGGDPSGLVMDIGSGSGAAGLALALRAREARLCCVDIDAASVALARENIALNGLASRADAAAADILSARARKAAGLADASAALILTNPPFYEPGRVRVSPHAGRARAHVGAADSFSDEAFLSKWMRACAALLAPGGRLVTIHRADALEGLLAALSGRFGGLRLLPVHPRADEPAIRLLAAAVKGSRAPLVLLPPLILHAADGRFTARAEAVHRGEAEIAL